VYWYSRTRLVNYFKFIFNIRLSKDLCQRHGVLPIAYLNMSLPHIEGTATLMTLSQLKEMFFAVCIKNVFESLEDNYRMR
jgi:hypothetical protein